MSAPTPSNDAPARVSISCPGCGRHDWVTWPSGLATYHWKCFNCGKQFDLEAGAKH
jgi:transposase-like protein